MSANDPIRREKPKRFLDASLVPLENALLARAETLDAEAMDVASTAPRLSVRSMLAQEFRALANELHYW